jgi:hypothetical protein
VRVVKEGNCFIEGTPYPAVDPLASAWNGPELGPRLAALGARWLSSACLCFALPLAEQQRLDFHYHYSIWQLEYSRNYLFPQAQVLAEVFQKLIDRTRAPLDIKTLETIFGRRHRQPTKKQQRAGRNGCEVAKEVDASSWEVTVGRVRWGSVVLKVYDKAGRVLRVEVKVLNTAGLGCGKGRGKLGEQLECVPGMLERFLASLQAAPVALLDAGQLERWAQPSQRGNRRLAGLDWNKARNRTMIAAVSGLATAPEGFTTAQVAAAVRGRTGWPEAQYSTRRAAYDLAKLRGKGLLEAVPGPRLYQCRPQPLSVLGAYVILREQVIKPVLAGLAHPEPLPPPPKLSAIDPHYLSLRAQLQRTRHTLGLAT